MHMPRVIILAAALVLAGCSRPSGVTVVTVTNRSSATLTNVVASGSGFSERIDSIAAGAEHKLSVRARGESGMRLVFDAGSQHVDAGEQGYFEAGGDYRVTVTIQTNLNVSVSSDTKRY